MMGRWSVKNHVPVWEGCFDFEGGLFSNDLSVSNGFGDVVHKWDHTFYGIRLKLKNSKI